MRKLIHFGMLMVFVILMNGCGMWQKSEKELEKVGVAKSDEVRGSQIIVEATLKNNKLIKIQIDETGAKSFDGSLSGSKKELKDEYNMRSYSDIGKEWYEQIEAFENYLVENGIESVIVDDEGKATNLDLMTQCTISVDKYLEISKEAVKNAEKSK